MCVVSKGSFGLNIEGVDVYPGSCSNCIYLFVFLNLIFVKWSFVLSTTHAKLIDGVTAVKAS